jgi:type VI secretion system protein ImpA
VKKVLFIMTTTLPLIDTRLDNSVEYQSLQFMADSESDRDVLGSKQDSGQEQAWIKIRNFCQQWQTDHHDIRLQILLYRSELVLGDLLTAFDILSQWNELITLYSDVSDTLIPLEQQQQLVIHLSYFFSDSHLVELRQSMLNPQFNFSISDLLNFSMADKSSTNSMADMESFQKWLKQQNSVLNQIGSVQELLKALGHWISKHNETGLTLQLEKVYKWLQRLEDVLLQLGATRLSSALLGSNTVLSSNDETINNHACENSQIVNSWVHWKRADVIDLMGQLCNWFELHEPTHPAPYLIRRSQRMMNVDFLSLMNELMPESVHQFEVLAGLEKSK